MQGTPFSAAKDLEQFRHEQTVKRWRRGNTKKKSKLVYISDFLDTTLVPRGRDAATTTTTTTTTSDSNSKRPPSSCEKSNALSGVASGALLLGSTQHRRVLRVRKGEHREYEEKEKPPRQKKKERNPQSASPINHRKRYTALKRRIHKARKELYHNAAGPTVDGQSVSQAVAIVAEMDALFAGLDAAMRRHEYRLAAVIRRRLQCRRHQLRRVLRLVDEAHDGHDTTVKDGDDAHHGEATSDVDTSDDGVENKNNNNNNNNNNTDIHSSEVYCNHYPSAVHVGAGRHQHGHRIDRRSGRHPSRLDPVAVQAWLLQSASLSSEEEVHQWWADLMMAESAQEENNATAAAPGKKKKNHQQQQQQLFVSHCCGNKLFDLLDDLAFTTLQGLYAEQRDLKKKQPMQFKARQRYVVGLQETIKHLRSGRVKVVVLAADMEVGPTPIEVSASLAQPSAARKHRFKTIDEAIAIILSMCSSSSTTARTTTVPGAAEEGEEKGTTTTTTTTTPTSRPCCITCMSRQRLSYALFAKASSVGCVGILKAEKNADFLKALRLAGSALRAAYEKDDQLP